MPGRPREHVLEEESCIALRALLPAAWTVEPVRRDYGLDARVEVFQDGHATGLAFWAQLKATDEADLRRALAVSFETSSLNYLSVQADPVLLVRFHAPSGRLFGTWLHRQDIRLKRAGQKSATVRWRLPDEVNASSPDLLAQEVRRFRNVGSPASLPLRVAVGTTGAVAALRPTVLALLRATLTAAGAPLRLVDAPAADMRLTLGPKKVEVDTPLATVTAETGRTDDPVAVADDAAAALAVGLASVGLPSAAVDLVLRCPAARLLATEDTAGLLAQAFGASGRWRDASDLALECLTGPPGRELLGRLLDVEVLLAARDSSETDARHVAANLAELARRQHARGENAGAAWYSAGNWLFHTVRDYPAALQAYEAAAEARPDYRTQDYWLQEAAAALFETGDHAAAAAMYGQALKAVAGPAPDLLAKTADCLAHTGDRQQAARLLDRYRDEEAAPAAPWLLKQLALRQLAGAPVAPVLEPVGLQPADPEAAGWHDWPSLVHPGLEAAEDLARLNGAASDGDAEAFLAVLTAACAFPAPDQGEPWAALLLLAWALREEHGDEWPLPGEVFDAALDTAVHRRGDALLRDLLVGGGTLPPGLLAEAEQRLREAEGAGGNVVMRYVNDDGSRDIVRIGFGPEPN